MLCKTPCPSPCHHESYEPAGCPLAELLHVLRGLPGGLHPPTG